VALPALTHAISNAGGFGEFGEFVVILGAIVTQRIAETA